MAALSLDWVRRSVHSFFPSYDSHPDVPCLVLQYTEVLGKGAFKTVYPFLAVPNSSDLFDSSWLDLPQLLCVCIQLISS
jgi:hypothetical protein